MKSIKYKIIKSILILILIPILITGMYFFISVRDKMLNNSQENINFYLNTTNDQLNVIMDNIKNISFNILSNDDVGDYLENYEDYSMVEKKNVQRIISDSVKYSFAWDEDFINSIFIVKNKDEFLTEFREINFLEVKNRNLRVHEQYKDFASFERFVKPNVDEKYIYYVLNVSNEVTLEPTGKLIIEVDPTDMLNSENIKKIYPNTEMVLKDEDENVLFSTINNDNKLKEYDKYEVSNYKYNLKVELFVLKSDIYKEIDTTMSVFGFLVAISLIFTLIVSYFIYQSLSGPLISMEKSINKMKEGDFTVRIEPTKYKEIDNFANAFNDMADNIDLLFGEVYEKGKELTKIERIMLQSQINPHFIFNVLEVINMKAREVGALDVSNMILSLGKLMRSNILLQGQETIPVKSEIEYVRYYLYLQKERFSDRLNYNISFDDEVLEKLIPKLIIQPLVENAVVHGIEPKGEKGNVSVNVWQEDNILYIKVADNGVGFNFDTEKIESENHNNVALKNIRKRLSLIYGQRYSFTIKSEKNVGTNIIISLEGDI